MASKYDLVLNDAVNSYHPQAHIAAVKDFNATKFATPREHQLYDALTNFRLRISSTAEYSLYEMIYGFYRARDILSDDLCKALATAHLRGVAVVADYTLSPYQNEVEEKSDLTTTEFIEIMAKLAKVAPDMVSEDIDKMVSAAKKFKREFM